MDDLAIFYPAGHAAHAQRGHPERPERVEAVREALQQMGVWEAACPLDPASLPIETLSAIHAPEYLETLSEACAYGMSLDMDTYTTPASWQLALNAAGGAAAVARAVWRGEARRGFALCRPPGHHATRQRGMGFCLLNNVALAAQSLLEVRPGEAGPGRLAIIDLDLHHGNGTQGIFWRRSDVLFISTHQWPFYPGSGRLEERGAEEGFGYTANLPLPAGSGDQAFRAAMDEWILPLLDRTRPQMLLVSFGFDPHWRDPLGSLLLSAGVYGELIARLAAWADRSCAGKIALVLEGGYDLEAAKACTQAAAAALLDKPFTDLLGPSPMAETEAWTPILQSAQALWNV